MINIIIGFVVILLIIILIFIIIIKKALKARINNEEQKQKLKQIQKENEIKRGLRTVFISYQTAIIILVCTIATWIVLIIGYLSFDADNIFNIKESWNDVAGLTFIASLIIAIISAIFVIWFINKISRYIAEKSVGYHDIFDDLKKEIKEIKTSFINFQEAPLRNLISWHHVEDIEKRSEKVWAVSYTLNWLTKTRIDKILNELKDNKNHEYKFIVIADNETIQANINRVKNATKNFEEKIFNETGKHVSYKDRFAIKMLNKNMNLPIPNDVVIYSGFREGDNYNKEIVVIATEEIKYINKKDNLNKDIEDVNNKKENYLLKNYDLRFDKNMHITRVKQWFDKTWNEILD